MLDAEKVQEGTLDLLGICDHIVASSGFLDRFTPGILPEDGVRSLHERFAPATSAVTLGERGVVGFDGKDLHRVPAIRVKAADTTGAGDIFHAGFLFALLAGKSFPKILSFANAAAGLSCRGVGGRAAIPSLEEIAAYGGSAPG